MKTTYYFSHDFNTRTDKKIKLLLKKFGWNGYGLFWAIVEDLYNNANALPLDYESIGFDLRTDDIAMLKSIINDFELFENDGCIFWSNSVQRRLDEREERSIKARKSAHIRWENANAMQTQSDGNAIKEKKVKKIKEIKESKESNFNNNPIQSDFNGLPDQYIESVKLQTHRTKNVLLENSLILDLWQVFKLQNLTGDKFYHNEHDVYKHFVNWFKTQKFESNGTKSKSRSERQSESMHYLLRKGQEEYAKLVATNSQSQEPK